MIENGDCESSEDNWYKC